MDISPLTLTCLVLGFPPSFASSCFVVSVYNKLNNLLRAGYFWHHWFSTTRVGTQTVLTAAQVQQHSDIHMVHCRFICKLHGHRMVVKYFIFFIFVTCCKRLCERDRGGKCTHLSVFQLIEGCNSATSLLHLLHHPCDPRNPVSASPLCACTGWQSMGMWRQQGWSHQRGVDVLDGQEPVVDAVHFLVLHPALRESKHRLLSNSLQIISYNTKLKLKTKLEFSCSHFSLAEHCVCQSLYSDMYSVSCRHFLLPTLISHWGLPTCFSGVSEVFF